MCTRTGTAMDSFPFRSKHRIILWLFTGEVLQGNFFLAGQILIFRRHGQTIFHVDWRWKSLCIILGHDFTAFCVNFFLRLTFFVFLSINNFLSFCCLFHELRLFQLDKLTIHGRRIGQGRWLHVPRLVVRVIDSVIWLLFRDNFLSHRRELFFYLPRTSRPEIHLLLLLLVRELHSSWICTDRSTPRWRRLYHHHTGVINIWWTVAEQVGGTQGVGVFACAVATGFERGNDNLTLHSSRIRKVNRILFKNAVKSLWSIHHCLLLEHYLAREGLPSLIPLQIKPTKRLLLPIGAAHVGSALVPGRSLESEGFAVGGKIDVAYFTLLSGTQGIRNLYLITASMTTVNLNVELGLQLLLTGFLVLEVVDLSWEHRILDTFILLKDRWLSR